MSDFQAKSGAEVLTPVIKEYPGIGELVTGSNDPNKVLFTALCMLNDPTINQYLLDCRLRLADRITKTVIFPREGMSLPEGQVFSAPAENEENK